MGGNISSYNKRKNSDVYMIELSAPTACIMCASGLLGITNPSIVGQRRIPAGLLQHLQGVPGMSYLQQWPLAMLTYSYVASLFGTRTVTICRSLARYKPTRPAVHAIDLSHSFQRRVLRKCSISRLFFLYLYTVVALPCPSFGATI